MIDYNNYKLMACPGGNKVIRRMALFPPSDFKFLFKFIMSVKFYKSEIL